MQGCGVEGRDFGAALEDGATNFGRSVLYLTNRPKPMECAGDRGMKKWKCSLLMLLIVCAVLMSATAHAEPLGRSRDTLCDLPPAPAPVTGKGCSLNQEAYHRAWKYFWENQSQFQNQRYITVIDYTKPSTNLRFFLIEVGTGNVQSFTVSHGRKSGWRYATRFSNSHASHRSSRGFFRTGDKYWGKYGPSLEMHGLEKGVNDKAYSRRIVLHGADYANPCSIVINRGRLGRSLGCPALPREVAEQVIDRIKDGSLLYVHAPEQRSTREMSGKSKIFNR